jgi:hypothetical protein
MDTEEILSYIVSHCEKISIFYEEIGTSNKACREQTQSLFESFVHLMNQQTKTITEERDSLNRKCSDTLSNIARYKRLMGSYVDDKILSTPKQPLLAWLSELCDTEEMYQRVSSCRFVYKANELVLRSRYSPYLFDRNTKQN